LIIVVLTAVVLFTVITAGVLPNTAGLFQSYAEATGEKPAGEITNRFPSLFYYCKN